MLPNSRFIHNANVTEGAPTRDHGAEAHSLSRAPRAFTLHSTTRASQRTVEHQMPMTLAPKPEQVALPDTNSRRRFLMRGSLAVCASSLGASWASAAAAPGVLTASRFVPLIGSAFSARGLASSASPLLSLWLRAVEPLAPARALDARAAEHSFVLSFSVEGTTAVQDTYALTHARVGSFAALLVPSRNAKTLTAVFNRSA